MLLTQSPLRAELGSLHSPLGNFFSSSAAGGLPEAVATSAGPAGTWCDGCDLTDAAVRRHLRSELPPPLLGTPLSPETQPVPSAICLESIRIKHDICVNYAERLRAPLSAAVQETVSAENVRQRKDGIISFFFYHEARKPGI